MVLRVADEPGRTIQPLLAVEYILLLWVILVLPGIFLSIIALIFLNFLELGPSCMLDWRCLSASIVSFVVDCEFKFLTPPPDLFPDEPPFP